MSSSPRPTTGAPVSSVTDHRSVAASSCSPPSPPPPNQRWAPHQVDNFELQAETTAMYLPASYKDHEPTAMVESSGEDHEPMAPKRRAEKWAQEEALCLVALRREVDGLFNISKSNKHLWCRISAGMRENGFDRSPTMCTDKWRNLLKEFKKARQRCGGGAKVCCFKEIEDLLRERCKNVDAFVHSSDRGEASGRYALNSEGCVDHDGNSLAITAAETVATGEAPSWNWMDATRNGGDSQSSYGGRVILVKWGECARKIGIDGTTDAIKDVIKSAFGLRTKRAFWLEDEDEVIRSLDRRMPLGTYTLHLDEGLGIKICFYDERDRIPVQAEAKTLYSEDDFRDFLARRGWTHLRQLDDGFKGVDSFDELREGGIYQGVRIFGDAL